MTRKRALGSVFQRASDGLWVARVTLPGGKRVTRYAPDQAGAERALALLMSSPDLAPAAPYTVGTWLTAYLKRANEGRAPATVHDREYLRRGIDTRIGKVRLDKLTPAQVQALIDGLTSHRARTKSLQLLRSALSEAVALGHLTRNVALPVKLPRQMARKAGQSWTQEEARRFLDRNEGTELLPLWTLALQTGARIGELLTLKVSDFDAQARTLRIERTLTLAKGDTVRTGVGQTKTVAGTRTFPLPAGAVQTLQDWLAVRPESPGGWLFPLPDGRMMPYDHARWHWKQALARADVPPIRTHDLRVTFISLALRRGVKPEVVARMVGHSSPLITLRIYRVVFEDELDETRDLLDALV